MGCNSYTVVLGGRPTGEVTVTVGGHAGTDLEVSPESVTFTTDDWDTAQTVTVTAGDDPDAENDAETLTHTVAGGGYDGVEAAGVAVTVEDDDRVIIALSGRIWLCGAHVDSPGPGNLAEIDICWDVPSGIPADSVVDIELRDRNYWDYPTKFSRWSRVARGDDFTPCDAATVSCVKGTQSYLYRGEPRIYQLRVRRGSTVLAQSPTLKAQAPNYDTHGFEPVLERAPDPGPTSCAVARPSGPFVLKLFFKETYPGQTSRGWGREPVPCLGMDARCLAPEDFDVTNGNVAVEPGKKIAYKVTVTPTTLGQPVVVSLPANKVKGVGEGVTQDGSNRYTRDNLESNTYVTHTSGGSPVLDGTPLTGRFTISPRSHDGSTPFTVRASFNPAVATTAADFREHVVKVRGGAVTEAARVGEQSNLWDFTIKPDSVADVAVWIPAAEDCAASDAVCTGDGRPLLTALLALVTGPEANAAARRQTAQSPLTAQFRSVPAEHDGETAFTFSLEFSEPISADPQTLRDHAIAVSHGRVERVERSEGGSDLWTVTVAPTSYADITLVLGAGQDCAEVGAVCTAAGNALASAPAVVVPGPAAITVADSRAREGEDVAIVFDVTLSRPALSPVTVDYATRDGDAKAGEDYAETSGTLTFAVGEIGKAVTVPLLDDAKDEGEETFTLVLRNASGARISDAEAVGTIENHDPLQREWIARFGRTVASQAVNMVGDRLAGTGSDHVTVGGIRVTGQTPYAYAQADKLRPTLWTGGLEPVRDELTMTGRDVLLYSGFQLSSGGVDRAPLWTTWGRFARDAFNANDDGLRLSGVVTTGLLGADVSRERWLAGVALGVSEGEGPFQLASGQRSNRASGTVDSLLTGIYPYARVGVTEHLDVWGMAGFGTGEMTIAESGGTPIATGIGMTMGATGARGALLEAGKRGSPVDLRSRADILWVRTKSDAVHQDSGRLESAESEVTRLRFMLEAGRGFALGDEGSLNPTIEAGARYDGGDAETGTGLEVGAGLAFRNSRVAIQGAVRKLIAHEASGYEEWGASASVRVGSRDSGQGLSFTVTPSWGADTSGMERMWSVPSASALVHDEALEARGRLDTEVGYGVRVGGGLGLVTPYAGLRIGGADSRRMQVGARWALAPEADIAFGVARTTRGERAPDNAIQLNLRLNW